ncbi:LysR family transcriptional regulator [Agromyces salentinus]|uniref:LysR family transcriptional regulator n=1 Tax=Agromyces salentinus TaxID=269421 RepID=A0ABP4Z0X6_9MICO|nr:LysR family transcriptional regulator [Agromyces salentinus]
MATDATDRPGAAAPPERHRGPMQLGSVDLNLLVPLQALLEERSVSRAADRMFMSQPALSAALARLRRHFDDELLVRSGNAYVLSPLGGELLDEVHSATSALSRLFGAQGEFRPSESHREFRLVCSDYIAAVFGAPLARAVAAAAPHTQLRFEHVQDQVVDTAPDSLRDIDGLVLPHGYFEHAEHLDLFTDTWTCIVAAPEDGAAPESPVLTIDSLGARPWAVTYSGRTAVTSATRQLLTLGLSPRTEVVTRSFLTLPDMVAGTDRVAFVPGSLASRFARRADVVVVESPLEFPQIRHAFWWSASHAEDAGHRWLREQVAAVAAALRTGG